MKLAEALSERSDIRTRISALQSRLAANARVQEGERRERDRDAEARQHSAPARPAERC